MSTELWTRPNIHSHQTHVSEIHMYMIDIHQSAQTTQDKLMIHQLQVRCLLWAELCPNKDHTSRL